MSAERQLEFIRKHHRLMIACREYVMRSYSGTPGRIDLLEMFENYEEDMQEFFNPQGEENGSD